MSYNHKKILFTLILTLSIFGYTQSAIIHGSLLLNQDLSEIYYEMNEISDIHSINFDSTNSSKKSHSLDSVVFEKIEKEPTCDMQKLQMSVVYPDLARRAEIEGKVIVRVLVLEDGKVKKSAVEYSDNEVLNQAALDAIANGGVFTPAIQKGKAIPCWVSVPILFKLNKKK